MGCWSCKYALQICSCFLSCVIDIYSKYAWVFPLKDKKGITITNAFHNILEKPGQKLKKNLGG